MKLENETDLKDLMMTNGFCKKCGGEKKAATVAHPIWFDEFQMAGPGKCEYETVYYCSKCEEEPDFHGSPRKMSIGEFIASDLI